MWDLLSLAPKWILFDSFLASDWVLYTLGAIFACGLVGLIATFIMRFIPFVYVYRSPIQLISIFFLLVSTFGAGWVINERAWQARAEEFKEKVAKAEQQSAELNDKLSSNLKQKTTVIRERGETLIQYVEKEIVKYNDRCDIPKEFNQIHNKAAEQPK